MSKPNGTKSSRPAPKPRQNQSTDELKLNKTLIKKACREEETYVSEHNDAHEASLRTLREEKGLSQDLLAKKMGLARTQFVRLEKRPWQKLSAGDLLLLSHIMKCSVEDLISYFNRSFNRALLNRSHIKNQVK